MVGVIMTFTVGGFDRERRAERLHDLIEQHIFTPDCVVIDGFDFAAADHAKLEGIRALMEELKLQTWFSATSHRDDARVSPSGVPAPCHEMDDLFETVALLKSYQDHVQLEILRDNGKKAEENSHLRLDPATMMVKQA